MPDSPGHKKPKSATALRSAAKSLREQALALGKEAHGHGQAGTKLEADARKMVEKLDAILADGGREDAEVPGILGDAMLDLMFVLQGGEGPTSLQLGSEIS